MIEHRYWAAINLPSHYNVKFEYKYYLENQMLH